MPEHPTPHLTYRTKWLDRKNPGNVNILLQVPLLLLLISFAGLTMSHTNGFQ